MTQASVGGPNVVEDTVELNDKNMYLLSSFEVTIDVPLQAIKAEETRRVQTSFQITEVPVGVRCASLRTVRDYVFKIRKINSKTMIVSPKLFDVILCNTGTSSLSKFFMYMGGNLNPLLPAQ